MDRDNIKKTENKKGKKQKMIIAIVIITVMAVISYILLENPQIFEKVEKNEAVSMYSDKLYSFNFYPADYERDVTQDEWYMQLDHYVHYKMGNVSIMVLPEEADEYNEAVRFFLTYFDTVIAGDAETYNSFFTDEYYESNKPYERFTPQMIYNIEVEQLSETTNEDGTTNWKFNVKYMIHKNDGTFRNDLDSDSSKKLCFELIADIRGNVKINNISR